MENDGNRMTILGMLVILAGAALVAALVWSFVRKSAPNTGNSSQDGWGAVN